jgi:hypothetical protein
MLGQQTRKVSRNSFFLWVLLFSLWVMGTANDARGQGDELLREAQKADPRWPGNGNFRLRARFKIVDEEQAAMEGSYQLAWATEKQWREEFTTQDFYQVRLRGEGGIWEDREPAYPTRGIWNLMHALMFYYRLPHVSNEVPGKFYLKKNNGSVFRCIKTKRNGSEYRELCFDEQVPQLAAEVYVRGRQTYVFGEYSMVGNGSLPGRIQIYNDKALSVDFHVEGLVSVKQWDAGVFEKPAKAVWRAWCPQPEAARFSVWGSEHRYYIFPVEKPWTLIYGRIGTDGSWHDLHVVKSGGFHGRDNRTLDEMRKVQGTPATCEGVPIELEMMVYHP